VGESRERRYRSFYDEHGAAVLRYIARRVPRDDVHDVFSETFLVAWRRQDEIPHDAVPWLFAVARRTIANGRRASRRRNALDEKLATSFVTAQVEPGAPDEIDHELLAAIRRLPNAEREAFMLVAWDGLRPARAARAAGCSGPTFRVRLHRARRRLRNELTHRDAPSTSSLTLSRRQMEELS
jgi:RNA polymerase sigma factor (sigma-70 family)